MDKKLLQQIPQEDNPELQAKIKILRALRDNAGFEPEKASNVLVDYNNSYMSDIAPLTELEPLIDYSNKSLLKPEQRQQEMRRAIGTDYRTGEIDYGRYDHPYQSSLAEDRLVDDGRERRLFREWLQKMFDRKPVK